MKKLNILGLALFAVLAFSAIVAASAFATSPEWLVDGAAVALGTTFHVEQTGSLLLADLKAGVSLTCTGSGLGSVGSDSTDLVEEALALSCTLDSGSAACETPLAEAVDLPWLTELLGTLPTAVVDMVTQGGNGEPGWKVTCNGFLTDTCKTEKGEPSIENMPAGRGAEELTTDVLTIFNQTSIATCTFGGANSGEVSGELLTFVLENLSLEVS